MKTIKLTETNNYRVQGRTTAERDPLTLLWTAYRQLRGTHADPLRSVQCACGESRVRFGRCSECKRQSADRHNEP